MHSLSGSFGETPVWLGIAPLKAGERRLNFTNEATNEIVKLRRDEFDKKLELYPRRA